MKDEVFVLEIKNKSIRLLVGHLVNSKLKIILNLKKRLSIPLNGGDVIDVGSLTNDIKNIFDLRNYNIDFNKNNDEVILVLPSFGLEVYNTKKSSNTVNANGEIINTDIKNVFNMVEKESVPLSNKIVCTLANKFVLDDGKSYDRAPLGNISQVLSLEAFVYTLPYKMVDDLKRAILNAGIKIKNTFIDSLCVANYFDFLKSKKQYYVYVSLDSKNTTLSLINKKNVFKSIYFTFGLDNLSEKIAKEFNIDLNEATKIRNIFGLDESNNTYNPPIIKSKIDGNEFKFKKENLNNITKQFLEEWLGFFFNSFKTLMKDSIEYIDKVPFIFGGNGLKLIGIENFILKNITTNENIFTKEEIIGVPGDFLSLAGAIIVDKEVDNYFKVITINKNIDNINSNLKRVGGNDNE